MPWLLAGKYGEVTVTQEHNHPIESHKDWGSMERKSLQLCKEDETLTTPCLIACDKMCKVSKKFDYRLDSGSVSFTDDRTHFGIYVGPF